MAQMVNMPEARAVEQNRQVFNFPTAGEMSDFAIGKWREISEAAIQDSGRFVVALSGGTTPVNLYRRLAGRKNLPWGKTHILLVDERYVPLDHQDSNYRMIEDTLLSHISIAPSNVHPIDTTKDSLEVAASEYEHDLKRLFSLTEGQFPRFDLIMLGIGEDGHTASLFPGDSSLSENKRLAIAVRSGSVRNERVSITLPVINMAANVMFLATGERKAPVIKKILIGKNAGLPAARVKPTSGRLFFLLDKVSGAHLAAVDARETLG